MYYKLIQFPKNYFYIILFKNSLKNPQKFFSNLEGKVKDK